MRLEFHWNNLSLACPTKQNKYRMHYYPILASGLFTAMRYLSSGAGAKALAHIHSRLYDTGIDR